MSKQNEIRDGGVMDPYTGQMIQSTDRVKCTMDSTGIIVCQTKEVNYAAPIILSIVGIIIIVIFFSIRIEVVTTGGSSTMSNPGSFPIALIPLLAILLGTSMAVLYRKS